MPNEHFRLRSVSRFSLIELLVVISIAMLLLGISLPAFSRLVNSGGVSGGSRILASKINGARSYAISHRRHVALLFPVHSASDSGVSDKLRYRAFRPAVVSISGANVAFSSWIDGEDWANMPDGTFFGGISYDVNLGHNNMDGIANGLAATGFTANSGATFSVANCLVFKYDGSLANTQPFSIGIWEGKVQSNFVAEPTNKSNKIVITVNQFTGRPTCSGR